MTESEGYIGQLATAVGATEPALRLLLSIVFGKLEGNWVNPCHAVLSNLWGIL